MLGCLFALILTHFICVEQHCNTSLLHYFVVYLNLNKSDQCLIILQMTIDNYKSASAGNCNNPSVYSNG